jgi:hypothetical protein
MARCVLLAICASARGARVVFEQPFGSIAPHLPRFEWLSQVMSASLSVALVSHVSLCLTSRDEARMVYF